MFLEDRIDPLIAVQLESGFIKKTIAISRFYEYQNYTLNMLDGAWSLRVSPFDQPVRPYLLAGVAYAILLSATSHGRDIQGPIYGDHKLENDFSAHFGIGGTYRPDESYSLRLELRYSLGLREILEMSAQKTWAFQILAGIAVDIS